MILKRISVATLRNLHDEALEPAPHLNVIHGENGSGKTSILEAIHILAHGRSFRSREIGNVIQDGAEALTVFARVAVGSEGGDIPIGVRRTKTATDIRIGGEQVRQVFTLAQYLPLLLITPTSHRVIDAERQYRREYLDWGVFHVEHQFYAAWKAYKTALKQRNAALKASLSEQARFAWDRALLDSGTVIDAFRRRYIEALAPHVARYAQALLDIDGVGLEFSCGWPNNWSFEEALKKSRDSDLRHGRTHYGPHRADLQLTIDGTTVVQRVSRGQQKLLVYALKLAQIALLRERQGKATVMLLDDLAAELDERHRRRLLELLAQESAQVFVTTTEQDQLNISHWQSVKMFHVERGRVRSAA